MNFNLSMKNIYIFIIAGLLAMACEKKVRMSDDLVPVPVKTKFKEMYPQADSIKWYLEETKYEAEFSLEGEKGFAEFDGNGAYIDEAKP